MKRYVVIVLATITVLAFAGGVAAEPGWTPLPTENDPLIRMPGIQPAAGHVLPDSSQCDNCHADRNDPSFPWGGWQGSMMSQAARDFLYWPTMVVAAQDAIWAVGTPNATDLCLRCHMPIGWIGGRSNPTNATAMSEDEDYDGVQCTFCHFMYDPFFEDTTAGIREGNDWVSYWDETDLSTTPSSTAAEDTYGKDATVAASLQNFNGSPFFVSNQPPSDYDENGGGQYFVDTVNLNVRRASFADANTASHDAQYSRYHKSKYFCGTCHDVSNAVLHNLGADPANPLPSETDPAYSYYHVERTFSEFMLSAYGQQGGADGIGPYAPEVFDTSRPGNKIATCQDCHLPDRVGKGADRNGAVLRPTESIEHPQSGYPHHDMTGGNAWVTAILASTDPSSSNYDSFNEALLKQGPDVLTLNMSLGVAGINAPALLDGAQRAVTQLQQAAAIQDVVYDGATGLLSFKIQNQTGHKLISGYPEGRRMFINIQAFDGEQLIYEINPYDDQAATLKGLEYEAYEDPDGVLPVPAELSDSETYEDELVYEMHAQSDLLDGEETFHFVLGTSRYKDNRIPPLGFRIAEAGERIIEPVREGAVETDLYSAAEYVGGYDAVSIDTVADATSIRIRLFYQTTSREYVEFLRNEINGTGHLTLEGIGAGGDPPYIVQTDPFFSQLKAWGDTVWQLWVHNRDLPGASPILMTEATVDAMSAPAVAISLSTNQVDLNWLALAEASGYEVWQTLDQPYEQPGLQCLPPDCTVTFGTTFQTPLSTQHNQYFNLCAVNVDGSRSTPARVGVYNFDLTAQ